MEGPILGPVDPKLSLSPIPTPNLREPLAVLDVQVVEGGLRVLPTSEKPIPLGMRCAIPVPGTQLHTRHKPRRLQI